MANSAIAVVVVSSVFAFAGVVIAALGYPSPPLLWRPSLLSRLCPLPGPSNRPWIVDGPPQVPLLRGMLLTLKNRAFLRIALSTAFYWFGLQVSSPCSPIGLDGPRKRQAFTSVFLGCFVLFNIRGVLPDAEARGAVWQCRVFLGTLWRPAGSCLFAAVGVLPLGGVIPDPVRGRAGRGDCGGFHGLPFALLSDAVD